MLHIIAEIGNPGKKDREKRHFPEQHNKPGPILPTKPKGRRYIPHNLGRDEWKPYIKNTVMEHTENLSSHAGNPKYPAAEIWPNNWKSMRAYPFTYRQSQNEWLLDPSLTKLGIRCLFNGIHKASATSDEEITHKMLFGKGRNVTIIDKRNSLAEASPGDKSYQVPEYSQNFYHAGSDDVLPRISVRHFPYTPALKKSVDRFPLLVPVPQVKKKTLKEKLAGKEKQDEIEEVKKLETWQPAKPIFTRVCQFERSTGLDIKKY